MTLLLLLFVVSILHPVICHLEIGCSSDEQMIRSVRSWIPQQTPFNSHDTARKIKNRDKKRHKTYKKDKSLNDISIPRVIEIPFIFHVLYNNSDENIPFHLIQRVFRGINEDFFGINEDKTDIAEFLSVFGNFSILFKLNKIYRKELQPTTPIWISEDRMKFDSYDGQNGVDIEHMLNIWICKTKDNDNYAISPLSSPIESDGVVVHYINFGVDMVIRRVMTHEIGHWLKLKHLWGQFGGCDDDDLVDDTPIAFEANLNCPQYPHISCNTTDMTVNFMDYTDCKSMFTKGQVERARNTFLDNGGRETFLQYIQNKKRTNNFDIFVNDIYLINSPSYIQTKCDPGDKQIDVYDPDISICISYSRNMFMDVIDPKSLIITSNNDQCDYYVILDAVNKYLCFSKISPHKNSVFGVRDIIISKNTYIKDYNALYIDNNLYLGYKKKRYYFKFEAIDHLSNPQTLIEADTVNIFVGHKLGNIEFNGNIYVEFDFTVHSLPFNEDCIGYTNIMSIGNSYFEDLPGFYQICNTPYFGLVYTHNDGEKIQIMSLNIEVNKVYHVIFSLDETSYHLEMDGAVIVDQVPNFQFDQRFGIKAVYMSQPHMAFDAADVIVNNLKIETGPVTKQEETQQIGLSYNNYNFTDYKIYKIFTFNNILISIWCTSFILLILYCFCLRNKSNKHIDNKNDKIKYDRVSIDFQ